MENKKEKNKEGKMTLEKLARMMADGFEEITTKVASKKDLNNLVSKVDNLVSKEEFRTAFGSLDERLDRVEHKLIKVENRVEEVYDILVGEEKQVLDLQKRVGGLERAVK